MGDKKVDLILASLPKPMGEQIICGVGGCESYNPYDYDSYVLAMESLERRAQKMTQFLMRYTSRPKDLSIMFSLKVGQGDKK